MANINLRTLFEQKQREFNVLGAGVSRFQSDFITCVNRVINRINRDCDLATEIPRVDDIEDTLAIDEEWEDVVSDGVSYYLHYTGSRPAKGAELLVPALQARFEKGLTSIYFDIKNEAWDSDHTTTNIGIEDMY